MRVIDPTLGKALALSLLLHALVLVPVDWLDTTVGGGAAMPEAQLEVTLRALEESAILQPPLSLDESLPPAARPPERTQPAHRPATRVAHAAHAARAAPAADFRAALAGDAARQASVHIARELFYPPEAIARGLEGEVLVLLFLDAAGDAIAARLEASSGHALLDDAAVRAARTLRAMPDSAPREVLLPVRFRLR